MKKITLLLFVATCFAFYANASIWRVNNNENVDADFTDLQAAIDDANVMPFDTIYLEASNTSYGSIDVDKPLVIIGAGYFLEENDSTQAQKAPSILKDIDFKDGSSGSVLYGCSFDEAGTNTSSTYPNVIIRTGNIKISRNSWQYSTNAVYDVFAIYIIADNLTDLIIENNYIEIYNGWDPCQAIYSDQIGIDLVIRNNYLAASAGGSDIGYALNLPSVNNNCEVRNNVFNGDVTINDAIMLNNVMISGTLLGSNNIYHNNIANETQFGNQNGNQENVDMATVFVDHLSGIDNGLVLKAGSPAIGAGFSGEDCGLFGGNHPYVLSGIPPIPAIFEIENSGIGNSGTPIQVILKAKSNR